MVRESKSNSIQREVDQGKSTLEFLLRRMQQANDLPAFSKHIREIYEKTSPTNRNYASASEIANVILKDYSLTNKLLKLVNSPYYGQRAGRVTTVTRAVVMLGFEQIRIVVSSILVFEHLKGKSYATPLKEEVTGAIFAGILGKEVAGLEGLGDVEEAFICSMLYNLGKILVIYYLPDEFQRIESYKARKQTHDTIASKAILGISYAALGRGVAEAWGFPEKIVVGIQDRPRGKISPPRSEQDLLGKIALFSNELCSTLAHTIPEMLEEEIDHLLDQYCPCLSSSRNDLSCALDQAILKFRQFSETLNLSTDNIRLIESISHISRLKGSEPASDPRTQSPSIEYFEPDTEPTPTSLLIAGIEDISLMLTGKFALRDALTVILETMFRGLAFHRTVLFLLNRAKNKMEGRIGFGPGIDESLKVLRFPLDGSKDVFNLAVTIGKDIRIDDSRDPHIANRIPQWYRESIFAPAFTLFPVTVNGTTMGLLYADKDEPGKVIKDEHIDYMRTLRNQAALALYLRGHEGI